MLIVLSPPMVFASGEDLHPIKAARNPSQRIFYIRYHPERPRAVSSSRPRTDGATYAIGRTLPPPATFEVQQDSLEGTLKPLDPRVFDVDTPEQFRKALGTLLSEISRM